MVTWTPLGVVGILMAYLLDFPIITTGVPSILVGTYPGMYSIVIPGGFPLVIISSFVITDGPTYPSVAVPLIEPRIVLVLLSGVIGRLELLFFLISLPSTYTIYCFPLQWFLAQSDFLMCLCLK